MKYGYCRVSSKDQNESRQLENMLEHGIDRDNIFVDKQSGKNFDRPEYTRLIEGLEEGDVIYIHSLDRLGRNYDMIIEEWNKITRTIKANIVVLDMPLLDTTVENSNLTGKFIADLVLQILSYVAETERNNIKKRQAEGIALAQKENKFDKRNIDMNRVAEMKKEIEAGTLSVAAAARELGISRLSMYRRLERV